MGGRDRMGICNIRGDVRKVISSEIGLTAFVASAILIAHSSGAYRSQRSVSRSEPLFVSGHRPRRTQEEHGRFLGGGVHQGSPRALLRRGAFEEGWREEGTHLSHFSLLFLHGSQLIAFLALLVGGRPSEDGSPEEEAVGIGDVLDRTVPAFVCFLGGAFAPVSSGMDDGLRSARKVGE
jgi:hypothetical protein